MSNYSFCTLCVYGGFFWSHLHFFFLPYQTSSCFTDRPPVFVHTLRAVQLCKDAAGLSRRDSAAAQLVRLNTSTVTLLIVYDSCLRYKSKEKKIQDRISQKENQQHGNGTEYYILGKKIYIHFAKLRLFILFFTGAPDTLATQRPAFRSASLLLTSWQLQLSCPYCSQHRPAWLVQLLPHHPPLCHFSSNQIMTRTNCAETQKITKKKNQKKRGRRRKEKKKEEISQFSNE